jgi:fanconi anemia group J protein
VIVYIKYIQFFDCFVRKKKPMNNTTMDKKDIIATEQRNMNGKPKITMSYFDTTDDDENLFENVFETKKKKKKQKKKKKDLKQNGQIDNDNNDNITGQYTSSILTDVNNAMANNAPTTKTSLKVEIKGNARNSGNSKLPKQIVKKKNVFNISGYKVKFPLGKKPFPSQFSVMGQTLRALHTSQNALLESPTGTGKTLALLCSSLSWQQHHMKNPPIAKKKVANQDDKKKNMKFKRIYFASRTHSQLTQVVNELKRCPDYLQIVGENIPHTETIKITILGARQHYCVHDTVSKFKGAELNENCKKLNQDAMCSYKKNLRALTSSISPVWDIEDLVDTGKAVGGCPYFASRDMLGSAHIVFAPYNYLLDPVIRRAMDIDLNDAVVIIDEAHNVESISREGASCELTEEDIINTIENLDRLIKNKATEEMRYRHMHQIFQGIQDYIHEIARSATKEDGSKLKVDGITAAALLQRRFGITTDNLDTLRDNVNRFAKLVTEAEKEDDVLS